MRIRNAEITDLESITQLWFEMMTFHIYRDNKYRMKPDAIAIYRNYANATILDTEKGVFVYEDNDTLLGYLFVEISDLPPVYEVDKIASVTEISVRQEMRRKGIGQSLLFSAELWAKNHGINRIECVISASNEVSQSFWKKNGYIGYNIVSCKEI
jgi:ribosomal protein S18 acetylase RimI-like enzyme